MLQCYSTAAAIMESESIQRGWRDARVIARYGWLNLEALAENYGCLMARRNQHSFKGINMLDRFMRYAVKKVV